MRSPPADRPARAFCWLRAATHPPGGPIDTSGGSPGLGGRATGSGTGGRATGWSGRRGKLAITVARPSVVKLVALLRYGITVKLTATGRVAVGIALALDRATARKLKIGRRATTLSSEIGAS